jgi:hypothetical protein
MDLSHVGKSSLILHLHFWSMDGRNLQLLSATQSFIKSSGAPKNFPASFSATNGRQFYFVATAVWPIVAS